MKSSILCMCVGLLASSIYGQTPTGSARSVIDNEIGSIFTSPNGFTWAQLGAYVGAPTTINFTYMSPASVKIVHGRFQHFKPSDDTTWAWFPYAALRQYETNEIQAGRSPIFVTATYAGKKRPVVWNWSLGLSNGVPTAPQSEWRYAVNVADERFIRFWIDRYVRGVLWNRHSNLQNLEVGLDECAFNPDLYGVIDDSGKFVGGVTWDSPFPQNETAFMQAIDTFFTRVHELAPDIKLIINAGTPKTWTLWKTAAANVDGLMAEEIFDAAATSAYTRGKTFNQLTSWSWATSQGKQAILRSYVTPSNSASVRNSFIAYLLLKGENTFFAPTIKGTSSAVPPSTFAAMRSALGAPVGPLETSQQAGMGTGYQLYSRQYEGGVVYLNVTGSTRTISLPTASQFFDAAGNRVAQLTIADMNGAYVLNSAGQRCEKPQIDPRLSGTTASDRVSVTLRNLLGSGTIRYTTDGSVPTIASPVYSSPFTLFNSASVKAIVTGSTQSSFVSEARFTVAPGRPKVQFAMPQAIGPAGTTYALAALDQISAVDVIVTYSIQPAVGSATTSAFTIKSGSKFAYFPVPVAGAVGSITTANLLSSNEAILGGNVQFSYTVGIPSATPPPPVGFTPIRVNAGGTAYAGTDGFGWAADYGFVRGTAYSTAQTISNTSDPRLYQTERWASGSLQYRFDVPNGTYTIRLKFAEIYFNAAGRRVFNIVLNGTTTETNFDPFAAAGGMNRAVDRTYTVTATNGQIAIDLVSIIQNPKINGIEITAQ